MTEWQQKVEAVAQERPRRYVAAYGAYARAALSRYAMPGTAPMRNAMQADGVHVAGITQYEVQVEWRTDMRMREKATLSSVAPHLPSNVVSGVASSAQ